ncbi:MAG: hypothetical protein C4519_15905 [Desulfobacteraceae bacterium]|nr:MAG: hypothetical protein C4519_15905 [Desulfobacteraceae bacterium]
MLGKKYFPISVETPAFTCRECGTVALDADTICKVLGIGKKGDWCGIKGAMPPKSCHTKMNNDRWRCRNCGQTSVNRELLCEPAKMDLSR